MAKKKSAKKAVDIGVCKGCWRYETFKENCMYFWENKSECSKFMKHMNDEERYVAKNML